ncbi:M23 family metallopeptidase [Rubrivirga litoralis]|uniref:M23 family metallopeptidase n=1 Tax=Rubrivirga litoralis TaxID=3075598 RepID=UPI0032C22A6B
MAPPSDTTDAAPARRQRRRRLGPRRRGRVPLGFPVRGPVSSPFGTRIHPVTGQVRPHRGVDLAVPVGTPVVATARGRVLSVGRRGGYGLAVEVGHRISGSLSTSTLYAHLSSLPAGLRAGLGVRRGAIIGFSGGVGAGAGISTGPHVHYEVRSGGLAVDPRSVALAVWLRGSSPNRAPASRVRREQRSRVDVQSRRRLAQRGIP